MRETRLDEQHEIISLTIVTWKAAFVRKAHVHAAIQHYVLATHGEKQTAPAHVLSSPQGRYFNIWHRFDSFVDKHGDLK